VEIILYQPEIPPNTGNVARLCAATDTPLHLIEPLGFSLDDRHLKRAGLDYWPHVRVQVWPGWDAFTAARPDLRLVYTSARRGRPYHRFTYQPGDGLVFGPETRGVPNPIMDTAPDRVVNIPISGRVRSINLATAAGVVLFEALRQTGQLDKEMGQTL
jgi:tRNA (cytidine/uridine-2'-O-)-methyltransferase